MMPIILRDMAEADIAAAIDMWVAAWTAAMPGIDFDARRSYFADRLEQHRIDGADRLIAVDAEDKVQGLLVVDPSRRYLDQLAVAPGAQGTGLARRLIEEAQARAPAGLTLHVNQQNGRALAFYDKSGWRRGAAGVNPRSGLPIWHYHWP